MAGTFATLLGKLVRTGNLEVETADGVRHRFGDGSGPKLGVRLTDRAAERELLIDPAFHLGELYMDGRFVVTEGSLYEILELGAQKPRRRSKYLPWVKAIEKARIALPRPPSAQRPQAGEGEHRPPLRSRPAGSTISSSMPDRQYSCAYFEHPGQSLDDAQSAKKRHIAAKLLVDEGASVLDIGCGFGGMALYLAGVAGAGRRPASRCPRSSSRSRRSGRRALGFAERLDFRLQDYRDVTETFDRIVSVGMFEHVGVADYDEYFQNVRRLLKDDGVMLLHSIGRNSVPGATNAWIRKYIFPGGYIPSLSEVLPAIERAGLYVTDIEILRLHYAETLRAWRERFMANWEKAAGDRRRTVLPDVGVLSGGIGDGVPRRRPHGLPDPARQAAGRRSAHPRLHRSSGRTPCAAGRRRSRELRQAAE